MQSHPLPTFDSWSGHPDSSYRSATLTSTTPGQEWCRREVANTQHTNGVAYGVGGLRLFRGPHAFTIFGWRPRVPANGRGGSQVPRAEPKRFSMACQWRSAAASS
jgi:hypothetical protein